MASEHASSATYDLPALIEQRRYTPRMRKALLRMLYGQSRHEAAALEGVSASELLRNAQRLGLAEHAEPSDRSTSSDRG